MKMSYHVSISFLVSVSPELFLSANNQVLGLEDLTESGYQPVRGEYNFEHTVLLFKTLAHFHAASYKLQQLDPASLKIASTETIFTERTSFKKWQPNSFPW